MLHLSKRRVLADLFLLIIAGGVVDVSVVLVNAQGGGGAPTCSGVRTRFAAPSTAQCMDSWANSRQETKIYPNDFDILNKVEIYTCPSSGKRVILSNGIPDHKVTLQNNMAPCEVNWAVEMPLYPEKANSNTEVPIRGMIAMALNGVPAYGPQESDDNNAVEGMAGVQGARFWYGHTGGNLAWHVHHPQMGIEFGVTSTTLLGYAMDGFPIYGPLSDDSELDVCNGRMNNDGHYQYHVRTIDQVDGEAEYCNGSNPEVNWRYILGCYTGSVANSQAVDSTGYRLDNDCVLNDQPVYQDSGPGDTPTDAPGGGPTPAPGPNIIPRGVNVIVMQPDDLPFFDEWSAPPNNPNRPRQNNNFPNYGIPNLERLRMNGLQMLQAYTASPVCGTSRYATITGKYPSRALSNSQDVEPAEVTIPTTKLEGSDCSSDNMAAEFQNNGYRTAMIGKWHLSSINDRRYTYDGARDIVKGCGFTHVEGLYIENLNNAGGFNNYHDGSFSHNMEWITHEAIKIINENTRDPFFMYFNPTVPHASNDVGAALRDYSCQDTADGSLGFDPDIPGMTGDHGGSCEAYRQSVIDRAQTADDEGPIWLDDGVGALLEALEAKGILDSTIFLFQTDHGMDAKSSLYEGGTRIPQFIHYPDGINAGSELNVPVTNLDIAATMFDFVGINPSYDLDGNSWKDLIISGGARSIQASSSTSFWEDRCLFFEYQQDRAVRCGCYKYLSISEQSNDASDTYLRGTSNSLSTDLFNVFDLCDGTSDYITDKANNQEDVNLISSEETKALELSAALECHLSRTDPASASYDSCDLEDLITTPQPSSSPTTSSPTRMPTISPTGSPSTSPTVSSTPAPTMSPSMIPTARVTTNSPTSLAPVTAVPTAADNNITAGPTSLAPVTAVPTVSDTTTTTSAPSMTTMPLSDTRSPTMMSSSSSGGTFVPTRTTASPSTPLTLVEERTRAPTITASTPTTSGPISPVEDVVSPTTNAPSTTTMPVAAAPSSSPVMGAPTDVSSPVDPPNDSSPSASPAVVIVDVPSIAPTTRISSSSAPSSSEQPTITETDTDDDSAMSMMVGPNLRILLISSTAGLLLLLLAV